MNKYSIILTIITVIGIIAAPALAYTLSAPIPGISSNITPENSTNYLTSLFNFMLAAAAILAVIVIVIAGLKLIGAAGNPSTITDAKDQIYWAILGLILALTSWLILHTINPALIELTF